MNRLGQLIRLFHINWVIAKYGLDQILFETKLFSPLSFLSYFNPWYWINKRRGLSQAERLRLALEELGPIYVKFGQILSTREDLLPEDYIHELEKLQDRVPPFPGELAKQIVETTYKKPLPALFLNFDTSPLASASIAQVHAATLLNGHAVVVKILRPNIQSTIRRDVDLLYTLAGLIERFWSHGARLRPREIVAEFEKTIFDELDLMREAANASQLRRNFSHSDLLYIPEVYWDFSRINIVVFERIDGIPVSDVDALRAQGTDLKKLAERGVEIFFTQVFRDSFFHADMHPGNIFVAKRDPKNPQYLGVDFGIMGSLSPNDQRYLAENLLAFFKRDYRRVAILHVESGWVPANTRVEDFEATIRAVCEPIFERPLSDISFGQLLLRLFQTARRYHMEVQPQLILLQKTLLNIEGLGRTLYPELDLWVTAKPFLERWIKRQVGPRAFLRKARERAPIWWEKMADIPDLIYETLQKQSKHIVLEPAVIPIPPEAIRKKHWQRGFFIGAGIALLIGVAGNYLNSRYQLESKFFIDGIWLVGGALLLLLGFATKKS